MFELLAASLQFLMHEKGRENLIWDFILLSGLRRCKNNVSLQHSHRACCQSRVHPKWLRGMTYSVYRPNSWPCDIWQRQWETERQMKCEQRWSEAAAPPACLQRKKKKNQISILAFYSTDLQEWVARLYHPGRQQTCWWTTILMLCKQM